MGPMRGGQGGERRNWTRILRILFCVSVVGVVDGDAYSWQRARPLRVTAQGGTVITVTGNFNASAAYACQFVSTDLDAIGSKFSAVAQPVADGTLGCIAPVWTYGAQETVLRIFTAAGAVGTPASDVRDLVPGPGATADRIAYAAVWQSRSISKGGAEGGISIDISGYGFDLKDADYVCKFICIHSSCDSLPHPRFAQSAVPARPLNDKLLKCISPLWPFTAFMDAGTTRIVLEKGGVELAYVGIAADGQNFEFEDKVTGADKTEGLATAASTLVSINGFGFDVAADDYSCQFSYTDLQPYVYTASPAVVISSQIMQCYSPHWITEARTTKIQIFKDDCWGSGSTSVPVCDSDRIVERAGGIIRFEFIAAVQNISVASVPAGFDSSPYSIFINGGGFTPLDAGYAIMFAAQESPDEANNLMELNVTASSVTGQRARSSRRSCAAIFF